jgi:hypothetical protein
MANPTSGASAVARLSPRRLTEVTFVLTTVYADSRGQIISRSDPGTVPGALVAGTGELQGLIFSQLPHDLPQASRVAP